MKRFFLLCVACLLPLAAPAQTNQMPAMMILDGKVIATTDGKFSPTNGDVVVVVDSAGKEQARTTVTSGVYSGLVVTLTLADNGTKVLAFRYIKGNSTYATEAGKEGDKTFTFSGSVFPTRSTMDVLMTATVISTDNGNGNGNGNNGNGNNGNGNGNGGTPTPTPVTGDVNGDGKLDETDVEILHAALAGNRAVNMATMDITKDGVFNTRDLIVLLQNLRTLRLQTLRASLPGTTTTTTGSSSATAASTTTSSSGSPIVQALKAAAGTTSTTGSPAVQAAKSSTNR
ncbi:hypothetical protein AZSI13_16070 [Azospira sp. I13]|uniref:dockerin type I repeat-containing protein n=1 Tax=Azospira sp. I13 TaxID=1765050 RepID=UPI000D43121E|nr:dockerin type I repeat-containing protein [Azospira sp. I13]GBG02280.1 hypothetical protein AZSI13_16070 [Azospira sp. I13]